MDIFPPFLLRNYTSQQEITSYMTVFLQARLFITGFHDAVHTYIHKFIQKLSGIVYNMTIMTRIVKINCIYVYIYIVLVLYNRRTSIHKIRGAI